MKIIAVILFAGLLGPYSFSQNEAKWIPPPDTLYYPFYNGTQLVEIDYTSYYENLSMQYAHMSQMPFWYESQPIGNEYLFRDLGGKITKTYNFYRNTDSVENALKKVPFVNRPYHCKNRSFPGEFGFYGSGCHRILRKVFNCSIKSYDDSDTVRRNDLKAGLIDTLGRIVVPVDYSDFFFIGDLIIAMRNKKWGLLDISGKLLVPAEYDDYSMRRPEQYIYFTNKDHYELAYHRASGKNISLKEFEYPLDEESGSFIVKKDSLLGVVNIVTNQFIVPCIFDYVHTFYYPTKPQNAGILVRRNGKFGVYSLKGKILLPCEYDSPPDWDHDDKEYLLKTVKNGKTTVERFPLRAY